MIEQLFVLDYIMEVSRSGHLRREVMIFSSLAHFLNGLHRFPLRARIITGNWGFCPSFL